ncbi:hypothetical protein B0H13DRAFT_2374246 [Mycena leptocephala]|nr:hypothetical protein B0H13DRAFT_2374246 [Mycena leptocephala]
MQLSDSPSISQEVEYFCPLCDACPTCSTDPEHIQAPHHDVVQAPARTIPRRALGLPFTLFVVEAYLQGGWLHLVIPYVICILVYYF